MAVSLTKGQRVSLEKVAPGLTEVFAGLGWDVKVMDTGSDFDLDSSVFLLGSNEKLILRNLTAKNTSPIKFVSLPGQSGRAFFYDDTRPLP